MTTTTPTTPTTSAQPAKRKLAGAIAGFFFFLFLAVELLVLGVLASDSILVVILPIAGVVVGIAWAMWAPLRRASR